MNTAFVLDLSPRGIRVSTGPGQVLGEVSRDDPQLAERLGDLRRAGGAPDGDVASATILLSADQVHYAVLENDAESTSMEARDLRLRDRLAAMMELQADEIAHDRATGPDGRLHVAAVPRGALVAAADLAAAHGFHPARLSARADPETFPEGPDFGASGVDAGRSAAVGTAPSAPVTGASGAHPAAGSREGAAAPTPVAAGERLPAAMARIRPRLGPAERPRTAGDATPSPGLSARARSAAGGRNPIRPDMDEARARSETAAMPHPPRPRRLARTLGAITVLLGAAWIWAALPGPGDTGTGTDISGVSLRAEQPGNAPGDPPAATTMAAAEDTQRVAQDHRPSGPDGNAPEAAATGRPSALAPESVILPVTIALATEAPEPTPAIKTRPVALGGRAGVAVTSGPPVVVPPARPAVVARRTIDEGPTDASDAGTANLPGGNMDSPALMDAAEPGPGLAAIAPRPRPAGMAEADASAGPVAIEAAVQTAVRDTPPGLGTRPRARPGGPEDADAAPFEEASLNADVAAVLATIPRREANAAPDALARSLRPGSRPGDLGEAEDPRDPVRVASADPAEAPSQGDGSSAAGVAGDTSLRLDRMNLIGVYGSQSNRRALVRLPNGRFVKVRVGDRVDGGRVSAIGSDDLQYMKGGRAVSLSMPRG